MTQEEHKDQIGHVDALFYVTVTATYILSQKLSLMFVRHHAAFTKEAKQNYKMFKKACDSVDYWSNEILKSGYACAHVGGDTSFCKVYDAMNTDANELIRLWIDVINAEQIDEDAPVKITSYARNLAGGKFRIADEVRDYFVLK